MALVELRPLRGTRDERASFVALLASVDPGESGEPLEWLLQTYAFLEANPRPDPWGSYLASEDGEPVGLCSFKFPPDDRGAVEIAYATFPHHRGRGVAGGMISALCKLALGGGATAVLARTLPEHNASNRALEREGFVLDGEVEDPDDGPVWEWRLERFGAVELS